MLWGRSTLTPAGLRRFFHLRAGSHHALTYVPHQTSAAFQGRRSRTWEHGAHFFLGRECTALTGSHIRKQRPGVLDVASSTTSIVKGLEISPSRASKSPHKTDTLKTRLPGFSTLPMTNRLRSGEIENMNFSSGTPGRMDVIPRIRVSDGPTDPRREQRL